MHQKWQKRALFFTPKNVTGTNAQMPLPRSEVPAMEYQQKQSIYI